MKSIVDRIEGDIAVCELENGKMINIPLSELPQGVKEGMALNGNEIDLEETEARTSRIREKMNRLFTK